MAISEFRWIRWNVENATKHGCTFAEIESVILRPDRGFPRRIDNEKWLVYGRGVGNRLIEVIYLLDDPHTAFVIHAMPLITRRRRGGR